MTQTLDPHSPLSQRPIAQNAAFSKAASNYAANRAALEVRQPDLIKGGARVSADIEWIFARDGSLTAMLAGQKWWGGCSVPRRAADFMFRKLEVRGVVGCFLYPVHAAQIRAALNLLEPQQAIVALVPDWETLRIILHCEDFAADVEAHRLWFAAGDDWERGLTELFVQNPGLPTPADFIRAISPDNVLADQMIGPAQKIIAAETARRGEELAKINLTGSRPAIAASSTRQASLCVVAPSQFRLWNDAPTTLARMLTATDGFRSTFFDSDDPASASPLELARRACGVDAVLTANLGRADLPAVVPLHQPVIAWITMPRIPAPQAGSPRDGLILADPAWLDRAVGLGWREDRIRIAGWPDVQRTPIEGTTASASMIADTHLLTPPKEISEYSSHLLLWELVVSELGRDPFLLKPDLDGYLNSRLARFQIDPNNSNRGLFIERLVVPAYQQGLAAALLGEGLPLKVFGTGWDQVERFAAQYAGPVTSREHFEQIVDRSRVLVHAWPISHAHPIDRAGRPVVRPKLRTVPASIEPACDAVRLTSEIIRELLA